MQEGELSFVNLSGKPIEDVEATNKFVRAHVMRRYKRQQRAKARKRGIPSKITSSPKSSDLPYAVLDEVSVVPTGSAHGLEDYSEVDVIHCTPGSSRGETLATLDGIPSSASHSGPVYLRTCIDGSLDPFSSLPIPSTPRSLMLLHQNANSQIRTSVHPGAASLYRKLCSKDPAWLFMVMFFAASRFPKYSRESFSEDTYYLLQSISEVNKSIAESPNQISNSTIATVSCLANIESLNGVASGAAVHMNGLILMVEISGGLENLGMQGILRRMVLWSDLLHSSRSGSAPHFPFNQIDRPLLHLSCFTQSSSPQDYLFCLNRDLASITTAKHHIIISQLLISLHELSTFLNMVGGSMLPLDAAYPDRVYEVEHHILVSIFDDIVIAESDDHIRIGIVLLHSGLLFIYTNLRQTPVGGAIRRRLICRLKAALDDTDISHCSKRFTAEMLWSFFVGALAAAGVDQVYFLEKIQTICFDHHFQTWLETTELLEKVPALESHCLAKCIDLWKSIQSTAIDS